MKVFSALASTTCLNFLEQLLQPSLSRGWAMIVLHFLLLFKFTFLQAKSIALYTACVFSIATMVFPQILKQSLLLPHSILLTTSSLLQALHSDKVLHKCHAKDFTDISALFFGQCTRTLEGHEYISVKPLVDVLQHINIYVCAYGFL